MTMLKQVMSMVVGVMLTLGVIGFSVNLTGCANTATQQIMEETKDPVALSRAAYLDSLSTAVAILNIYTDKYQDYVMEYHPNIHVRVIELVDEMDKLFTTWNILTKSGVAYNDGPATFETIMEGMTKILLEIDRMIEEKGYKI